MAQVQHKSRTVRTPDERRAARRAYLREYMRKYRAAHPDKARGWRIRSAQMLLEKEGYTVGKDGDHGE